MIMKKLIVILTLALIFSASCAYAQIPDLIRYQGTAVDTEGIALEGPYDITLRIYNAEVGGTPIWQETHQQVSISKGVFTVLLGEITALDLPFDQDYYLSIEISSDGEMSPRQRITSVGYAYRAKVAELATEAETAQSTQEVAGYSVATDHSPASQIYASKSDGYMPEIVNSSSIKDGSITSSKLTNNSIDLSTKTTGILPIEKGGTGAGSTRYCNLGLNTTGTLPIQYGGTGTDEQAYCDLNLNTSGTLPIDKGGTGNSTGDADTVDGIHASSTPEANKLVSLDTNAQLPIAVIPDGSITQAKLEDYAPGECLLIAADAEVSGGSSYVKKKEIKIARNGTIRFKWRAWANYSQIYTRVYRNGVPVGNEHHLAGSNNSIANYSEDISGWSAGDLAQLYVRGIGTQKRASHFRLYIDKYIEEIILLD